MKEYKVNGKVIEITLESGKVVKVSTEWAKKTMKVLDTDLEDVLLMWLEDEGYLENEEQEELTQKAKENKSNKIVSAKATTEKKKTQKERTQKPQPEKEYIISRVAEFLGEILEENDTITVENKAKLITFSYKNHNYKLDLVQKREKKAEK